MNLQQARHNAIAPALVIATALLLGNPGFAEIIPFRVVFENVPGVEEIEAGNIQAGIEVLEDQLNQVEQGNSGDILTTLCAAYIVNISPDKAEGACNKAVEVDPTETAYNNRGVFRAFTGDFYGAREDFERVRPRQLEAYMDELRTKDVGLVAANNFHLIDQLLAEHTATEIKASIALRSAAIEDLRD
jgi:tetratricopeptide (TPR) repeat protein